MSLTRYDDPYDIRGARFIANNVTPHQSFTFELLEQADGQVLRYDGDTITLNVDNGRWIWRVVDIDRQARLVHGRWPD